MPDLHLREFLIGRGADPADGIRHLAPEVQPISVKKLVSSFPGRPLPWTPTSVLAKAVELAGFLYDPGQDIIYSRMNPAQRIAGYGYQYDVAALAMNAVIDCEPIFFDYAGKHWMIELWKGQYGLETGCEIGVYNRSMGSTSPLDSLLGTRPGDLNPAHNLLFDCAIDSDRLTMAFILYRNDRFLLSRGPEEHWWLTAFKWGVLSPPEELKMDIRINCHDSQMRSALSDALQGMGYRVDIISDSVRFRFATPTSKQPRFDTPTAVAAVEVANRGIVDTYIAAGFSNNDPNDIPDWNFVMAALGRLPTK